ncbi:MAG: GNAT family N-acetyltransferase [Lachnospiraceae bacterium]|nr:GNAT family N-acetyltransferase [Lachnospiraceae bacterium]
MESIVIRDVKEADAERLCEIYRYYVEETAISFEYEAPSKEEFAGRITEIKKHFPYICAEVDGKIVGYAYASKFHPREAYKHCAEMSIYIDKDARKSGLGRKLYEELEKRLKSMGIINLYACIAYPVDPTVYDEHLDTNSPDFHKHMGYVLNGEFHKCGYKFGKWYNMIWMEKFIAPHK